MPLSTKILECGGHSCPKCGKCRDHGARAGAREGAAAGAMSVGALAGVSIFLLGLFGPIGGAGLLIAVGGAVLGSAGAAPFGAAVGAGMGAALGAVGGGSCEAGICKCHGKHRRMS